MAVDGKKRGRPAKLGCPEPGEMRRLTQGEYDAVYGLSKSALLFSPVVGCEPFILIPVGTQHKYAQIVGTLYWRTLAALQAFWSK